MTPGLLSNLLMGRSNWGGKSFTSVLDALNDAELEIGAEPKFRCLFCGEYKAEMKQLIDHFSVNHGAVL